MKRLSMTGLSIIAIVLSVSTSAQARGHKAVLIQPMTKISNNIPTASILPRLIWLGMLIKVDIGHNLFLDLAH